MRITFFLFGALLFAVTTLCAQTPGAATYQAAIWDKDVTLPPGSYRAAKPLGIEGDLNVRTQAHTLLEGVAFLTRGGRNQHYHLEGTLLRRCRFTVKLSGSGHAIDSVLEDCDFAKDDAWFVDFWSTRWQFDNCVFTKKFVRDGLPPLDYSVHASRCTVYATKLPPVYFRGNSGDWMGKNDMVFEKCRFVGCDVPQSFLACTKDCVFEGCRFEPKTQLKWPKETNPIKVHAYFASGGSEPPSFINGPLSVEFEKAPMNVEAGSTVPHTQSGGRITLTKDKLSDQFTMLATVPKKASEIVEVAAATPAPSEPVAAATPAGNPAGPAANEVGSVEEILRALPSGIEVMSRGLPNPAGVEAANAFLTKTFAGRPAALRLALAGSRAATDEGYAYQAVGKPQGVLYHGATIPADVSALFRAANVAPLAKAAVGSEVPVRGVVRRAEFVGRGTALGFSLVVVEARVVDALSLRSPAAAATNPAVAGADAGMVGKWTALRSDHGLHVEHTYNADHSFFVDGDKRFGTWETTPSQFIIHLSNGATDTYDLPVRDGVLYGKNNLGWKLTLVRQGTPTPPVLLPLLVGTQAFDNHHHKNPSIYEFTADGTFKEGAELRGRWSVLGKTLLMAWEGHDDWNDVFELPGEGGVLHGTNSEHQDLVLTRRGGVTAAQQTAASAATTAATTGAALTVAGEAQVVGKWTVLIRDNTGRGTRAFTADHAMYDETTRMGTWELTPTQFIARLNGGGVDTYELPPCDGALHGKNLLGWNLTLFRQDAPVPPAYLAQVLGKQEFNNRARPPVVYDFKPDGSYTGSDLNGRWAVFGSTLLMAWDGHTDWNDVFELPGTSGVIYGTAGTGRTFTLTRTTAAEPSATKTKDTYFGKSLP